MPTVLFSKGVSLNSIPTMTVTRTISQAYLHECLGQLAKDYVELAELKGTDIEHLQVPASQVLADLAAIIDVQ